MPKKVIVEVFEAFQVVFASLNIGWFPRKLGENNADDLGVFVCEQFLYYTECTCRPR